MCKTVLQNDILQDPEAGVNYFNNTLKKFFLKGSTNVCLYTQNFSSITEGRTLSSSYSHQNSRDEIEGSSVQDAKARRMAEHQQAAGARTALPDLLSPDNSEVPRQYLNGMQTRHRDAFPLNDSLRNQGELSDQQRERLICNVLEEHLAREVHLRDDEDAVPRSLRCNKNIHPRSIHPTLRRKSK